MTRQLDPHQLDRHLTSMENTLTNVAYELKRVTRELQYWREQLETSPGQQELPTPTPERPKEDTP